MSGTRVSAGEILALAETMPELALTVSFGRVRRTSEFERGEFLGVYVPSPVATEYVILLNGNAPLEDRTRVLKTLIMHHVLQHVPQTIYMIKSGEGLCPECRAYQPSLVEAPHPPPHTRSLRRHHAYS